MPPRITIHVDNSGLGALYDEVQARINAKFHSYELQAPKWGETDEEGGIRQTYQAYADHAGDHLPPGIDVERTVV